MKILFWGTDDLLKKLMADYPNVKWEKAAPEDIHEQGKNADAFFNMDADAILFDYSNIEIPVFINSVTEPIKNKAYQEHLVRICGWNGFLERSTWEIAGQLSSRHIQVMEALGKKYLQVQDQPGFIAPRVIAMIINEAYFARMENVSTENEMDVAMKLGTNYPKGPFEWKNEIGIKQIAKLLLKLTETDIRYTPCKLLLKEAGL